MTGAFLFRSNFPGLSEPQIAAADAMVLVMWSGMFELWAGMDQAVRDAKRNLMENLLVAHYLAENYPGEVVDAISTGAIPLTGQSVGGVNLAFKDMEWVQGDMKGLMTSQWGIQALRMYQGAPERFLVFPG